MTDESARMNDWLTAKEAAAERCIRDWVQREKEACHD
jgi:hypothetical protein